MAKRISGSSVNWEAIAQIFKEDRAPYLAFKAKTDKHLKKVADKAPELPKIDWAYYKARIATPSFVDSFQKSYEGFKIPYPSDQGAFAKLENKEKELFAKYKKQMQEIDAQIAENEKRLSELNKELKYSEMSIEEFFIARPELAFNPDKPRMWPINISDEELKKEKD